MELELKFTEVTGCEPVGDLVTTQEESMETAIPEYCPDMARIVDTVGQLRLREKHLTGQQLTVSGSVVLTVLYTSEESTGLRSRFPARWRINGSWAAPPCALPGGCCWPRPGPSRPGSCICV